MKTIEFMGTKLQPGRFASPVRFGLGPAQVDNLNVPDSLAEVQGLLPAEGGPVDAGVLAQLRTIGGNLIQWLQNLPQGRVDTIEGQVHITSWAEGLPVKGPEPFPEGQRLVFGPETSVDEFLVKAFGKKPQLVICPVGWTIPDPDTLAALNPVIYQKFETAKASLAGDADLEKKLKKAKKAIVAEFYQSAFQQWWKPIQTRLEELIAEKGLDKSQIAFITSASYDGVDKAAIDFARSSGIKVANITPYIYAEWMDTKSTDPLLVTNSIADYADACSQAADVLLVTGGREHALKEDIGRALIGRKAVVIPADILEEAHGLTAPATYNGKIENAARYMIESGLQVSGMKLASNPRSLSGLTQTQAHVVTALEKIFNQVTIGNFPKS